MLDKSALLQLKELKKEIHDSTPRDNGVVKGTRKRFGFVTADTDGQQYLLPQTEMERVLPGDYIQFVLETGKNKDDKPIARIEKCLKAVSPSFIGVVKEKNGQMYVLPDHPELTRWVFIPPKYRKNLKNGDFVGASICQHPFKNKGRVQAEITGIIGQPDDPFIEHRYAIVKQQIPEKIWQDDEIEAVRHLAEEQLEAALSQREDLRDKPFFTIDGATTQDLDDALSIETTDEGYLLHVAIADVAAFVEPDSPLDKVARAQGSSVYLPGQKLPMLPDILSSNLCSLKADEDRLALVCELQIDKEGNITNTRYLRASIRSKAKLSYEEVSASLAGEDNDIDASLQQQIQLLHEMANIRKGWRKAHALLMEEFPDYRYQLNEKGKITAIERADRNDAQRLVEECMLACNEATARYLSEKQDSALYWGHNGFKKEQLPGVEKLLTATMPDVAFDTVNSLDGYRQLQQQIAEQDHELPLKDVLRKKLNRSEWVSAKTPHFGLGLQAYTTFTSPIRKYSDLMIHRMIIADLEQQTVKAISDKQLDALNNATQAVRNAQRDCELSLKCQYMEGFKGKTFSGEVSMINHRVIGVYLEEFDLHGQIEVRSLNCAFTFKQESLQLLSEVKNFKLKQVVDVEIEQIDTQQNMVKLKLIEPSPAKSADDQDAA